MSGRNRFLYNSHLHFLLQTHKNCVFDVRIRVVQYWTIREFSFRKYRRNRTNESVYEFPGNYCTTRIAHRCNSSIHIKIGGQTEGDAHTTITLTIDAPCLNATFSV
jgi:hypothetical protein